MSHKWRFGKRFIGHDGNLITVNEVDRLDYRGWPGFDGVTLRSWGGKTPGASASSLLSLHAYRGKAKPA